MTPPWLPAMCEVNGVPAEVFARLYSIFTANFKTTARTLDGMPVWWDRTVLPNEKYEEGFFHLVTRGTAERNFDPRRAERLPWCGPAIGNCRDPFVTVWDYREGRGRIYTYVWLDSLDYVVILHKQTRRIGPVAFLVTAYHVDGDSVRRRLRQKYKNREP